MIQPTRRGFLVGLLAAPLIVRAASIMPVKAMPVEPLMAVPTSWRYTGNGGENQIWAFRPDFIFVKSRETSGQFVIYDTVRTA